MSSNPMLHSVTDVLKLSYKSRNKSDDDEADFIEAHLRTYTAALQLLAEHNLINELKRRTSVL